jgi:membrane protein implicated in regulation of membrane protease activity
MTFLAVLPDRIAGPVTSLVLALAGGAPAPEDVKAGWTAFVVFLLLVVAVAFLGRSLFKQLRKAQAAQEAGVYDGNGNGNGNGKGTDRPAPGPDDGESHRS